MHRSTEPMIIQGGMGAAVSAWPLAKAVAQAGQLGVVSGTALDVVLARRLQLGDPGGHLRRALDDFPFPAMAARVLERYFIPGGKPAATPFRTLPLLDVELSAEQCELLVVANFVEVYLAKEGHDGLVGINYLEKIQAPTLPSLFGALLAGVDYVLMGAGIPRTIPGILDALCAGQAVEMALDVQGVQPGERFVSRFDPQAFCKGEMPWLERPRFLAIVSSSLLATMLARKSNGRVDGFVVEGPTAGGHNAPPRGPMQLNELGEPIYGPRDVPDLEALRSLGLPFWLAGSYGSPERLQEAIQLGAAGIQVGTAFAFCEESGLTPEIKRSVLSMCRNGQVEVRTDPQASPTGFPFKVLQLSGTNSDDALANDRRRLCDLGYLRTPYRQDDGTVGWRCPAENPETYVSKGGELADTVGRKCLCNGLLANVGLAQTRKNGQRERPLVTSGDDILQILRFLPEPDAASYTAQDVIERLLAGVNIEQLRCVTVSQP